MNDLRERTSRALNKLCKWRTIFAGWQLGTRANSDPECQAVRDHREVSILLRVEVNALTQLMVSKGIFSEAELQTQILEECEHLERALEAKFPGATSTDAGISFDPLRVAPWMSNWRP